MTFVRELVTIPGGSRVAYLQSGAGEPLLHVQPGEPRPTAAHERLSQRYRVLAIDGSGGGATAVVDELDLGQFAIWATGSAAHAALDEVLSRPEGVTALVLESPELDAADQSKLADLDVLSLVLFGTDDPASRVGSVYKERLKRCFLVLVYGAGKDIAADRPQALADMIDDFLQRQDRFVVSATPSVLEA